MTIKSHICIEPIFINNCHYILWHFHSFTPPYKTTRRGLTRNLIRLVYKPTPNEFRATGKLLSLKLFWLLLLLCAVPQYHLSHQHHPSFLVSRRNQAAILLSQFIQINTLNIVIVVIIFGTEQSPFCGGSINPKRMCSVWVWVWKRRRKNFACYGALSIEHMGTHHCRHQHNYTPFHLNWKMSLI